LLFRVQIYPGLLPHNIINLLSPIFYQMLCDLYTKLPDEYSRRF
jgi:hypothetical protein